MITDRPDVDFEFTLGQSEKVYEQFARLLVAYRSALIDAGMKEELADVLTTQYQYILVTGLAGKK